ncbi:MAG: hypothetical protein RLZZ524_1037, partial [Pseudomonadota bacterium]
MTPNVPRPRSPLRGRQNRLSLALSLSLS